MSRSVGVAIVVARAGTRARSISREASARTQLSRQVQGERVAPPTRAAPNAHNRYTGPPTQTPHSLNYTPLTYTNNQLFLTTRMSTSEPQTYKLIHH